MDDVQVKVCLQEIVKLDLKIKAIVQDIQDNVSSVEELNEVNTQAREGVQELKSRLEELEKLAREQDKETDRVLLQKEANNHRKQLTSTQTALRKANVTCQLSIDRAERDFLFDGSSQVRQRPKSNKETAAKTSSQITENLMSISRMMSAEVKRGEETMDSLVRGSKQVGDINEEFKSMSGHIQNARKLLTKYSRRECTDKLLIFLALVFFFSCVLYILKKRLLSSQVEETPVQPPVT